MAGPYPPAAADPRRPGVLEQGANCLLPFSAIVRRSSAFRGRTVTVVKPFRLACAVVVVSLLLPVALSTVVLSSSPAGADSVSNDKAKVASLLAQLNALDVRSQQLAENYDQAVLHLQQVNTSLASDKAQLGKTGTQLTSAQQRVRTMAIEDYEEGGAARQLSLLIPGSADQIAVRGTYVAAATGSDNEAIDELRAAHIEFGRQQATLASAQAEAQAAVAEITADQTAAADSDAEVKTAYAEAQAQLGQAELQAAEAQQAAANQARIEAEAARSETSSSGYSGSSGGLLGGGGGLLGGGGGGGGAPVALPPPDTSAAQAAIYYAEQQLGKPYVYGGAGPDVFDCSGLTAWAWGHAGHYLPHSSEEQYYDTTFVPVSQLQPGDLVFYGMPPHHVGIYVGNSEMIDALHTGTNVEYDTIYIESDLIGGGRVY
jgi:cell wall-associated NlpC family hydrolase